MFTSANSSTGVPTSSGRRLLFTQFAILFLLASFGSVLASPSPSPALGSPAVAYPALNAPGPSRTSVPNPASPSASPLLRERRQRHIGTRRQGNDFGHVEILRRQILGNGTDVESVTRQENLIGEKKEAVEGQDGLLETLVLITSTVFGEDLERANSEGEASTSSTSTTSTTSTTSSTSSTSSTATTSTISSTSSTSTTSSTSSSSATGSSSTSNGSSATSSPTVKPAVTVITTVDPIDTSSPAVVPPVTITTTVDLSSPLSLVESLTTTSTSTTEAPVVEPSSVVSGGASDVNSLSQGSPLSSQTVTITGGSTVNVETPSTTVTQPSQTIAIVETPSTTVTQPSQMTATVETPSTTVTQPAQTTITNGDTTLIVDTPSTTVTQPSQSGVTTDGGPSTSVIPAGQTSSTADSITLKDSMAQETTDLYGWESRGQSGTGAKDPALPKETENLVGKQGDPFSGNKANSSSTGAQELKPDERGKKAVSKPDRAEVTNPEDLTNKSLKYNETRTNISTGVNPTSSLITPTLPASSSSIPSSPLLAPASIQSSPIVPPTSISTLLLVPQTTSLSVTGSDGESSQTLVTETSTGVAETTTTTDATSTIPSTPREPSNTLVTEPSTYSSAASTETPSTTGVSASLTTDPSHSPSANPSSPASSLTSTSASSVPLQTEDGTSSTTSTGTQTTTSPPDPDQTETTSAPPLGAVTSVTTSESTAVTTAITQVPSASVTDVGSNTTSRGDAAPTTITSTRGSETATTVSQTSAPDSSSTEVSADPTQVFSQATSVGPSTVSAISSSSSSWVYEEPYTPTQSYLIFATTASSSSSTRATTSRSSSVTNTASGQDSQIGQDSTSTQPMASTASIPYNVPTIIVPANNAAATQAANAATTKSDGSSDITIINVLLNADNYPWSFVVNNSDATSQLFILFPQMISVPLNIQPENVTTYALEAYAPASYNGDSTKLLTKWIGYIPTSSLNDLTQFIRTPSSPLYTQGGIVGQLAKQIDASYPLVGAESDSGGASTESTTTAKSDKKRRDTIIGVCVGVGGALWVVLVIWVYRRVKRSHDESVHKRMSDEMVYDPFGDEHRRSMVDSIAASEVDARPSSFYANPEDNDRDLRDRRHQSFQSVSLVDNDRLPEAANSRSSANVLSAIGSSWFRSSGSHYSKPKSSGARYSDGPERNPEMVENPFADVGHRSYLADGGGRAAGSSSAAGYRRSAIPFHRPINKQMIGHPTLQNNSLEFHEHP